MCDRRERTHNAPYGGSEQHTPAGAGERGAKGMRSRSCRRPSAWEGGDVDPLLRIRGSGAGYARSCGREAAARSASGHGVAGPGGLHG